MPCRRQPPPGPETERACRPGRRGRRTGDRRQGEGQEEAPTRCEGGVGAVQEASLLDPILLQVALHVLHRHALHVHQHQHLLGRAGRQPAQGVDGQDEALVQEGGPAQPVLPVTGREAGSATCHGRLTPGFRSMRGSSKRGEAATKRRWERLLPLRAVLSSTAPLFPARWQLLLYNTLQGFRHALGE